MAASPSKQGVWFREEQREKFLPPLETASCKENRRLNRGGGFFRPGAVSLPNKTLTTSGPCVTITAFTRNVFIQKYIFRLSVAAPEDTVLHLETLKAHVPDTETL